jgi:hypothetical protein
VALNSKVASLLAVEAGGALVIVVSGGTFGRLYSTVIVSKLVGATDSTSNQPSNSIVPPAAGVVTGGDVSDPSYGCGDLQPFLDV